MPLTPTQLSQLKVELQTDPRSYGYAADLASGNDAGLVAKLTLARDGTNGGPAVRLNNTVVDTGAIRTSTTKAVYDGLSATERTWFNWLTGAGSLVVTADLLQTLAGIPTAGGSVWSAATRTAMNAAMERLFRYTGSRAQELFGVQVTDTDVAKAKVL